MSTSIMSVVLFDVKDNFWNNNILEKNLDAIIQDLMCNSAKWSDLILLELEWEFESHAQTVSSFSNII